MIIDRLAKLDETQRKTAAVSAVVVMACLSYYIIIRGSVMKLQAAKAKYAGIRSAYAGTENQLAPFSALQKKFEDVQKQFEEKKQKCFTRERALQFFENINTIALAHNLTPISRIIYEPRSLFAGNKTEPQQQFLKSQSAKVVVRGDYFDIIDFVNELTGRPQTVCITDMYIALTPVDKVYPRASFNLVLLIDSSGEVEK